MTQQFHTQVYTQIKTKTKTLIQKDTGTPIFTAALFTRAKTRKQPNCLSTDEWMKPIWYVYTVEYCCCC